MAEFCVSNTDCQIILDPHAAIAYMAKYATKAENASRSLQSIIKNIVSKADLTGSTVSALRSAMIHSVGHRDIGQGEASRILLSGHHCECTFTFAYVSLDLEEHEIEVNAETGDLSTKSNLLNLFGERHRLVQEKRYPDSWDLLQPNFVEFCRHFQVVKGQLRLRKDPPNVVVKTFPCYRNNPNSPQHHLFCRVSYIKYAPWTTSDIPSILNDSTIIDKWEEFEVTCLPDLRKYFKMDLELSRRLKQAEEDAEFENDHGVDEVEGRPLPWQQGCNMGVAGQQEQRTLDLEIDQQHNWKGNYKLQYTNEQLKTAPGWISSMPDVLNPDEQLNQLPLVLPGSLSVEQRMFFDMVVESVESNSPLLLIVNGSAGTGKTHTIAAISHRLEAPAVIRCAFTAQASFLVRGRTIHGHFNIPINCGTNAIKQLDGIPLMRLQNKFARVKLVILDEYSMLSKDMLTKIDFRLREAKCKNAPFGGISVVLIGDPAQLPPVCSTALYSRATSTQALVNKGEILYSMFTKVITLTEIRRQVAEENDVDQATFIDILSRVRIGACTIEDWKFLQTRKPENIPGFELIFKDAIRLFSTNDKVDSYNARKPKDLGSPVTRLTSRNHPDRAATRHISSDRFRGLPNLLYISNGCQVTLTSNIQPGTGLTNGTKGTVIDIVYLNDDQTFPNVTLPSFVVVNTPTYIGPPFFSSPLSYAGYIPLGPQLFSSDDFKYSRKQYPLRLAYALTIHKSQGSSIDIEVNIMFIKM